MYALAKPVLFALSPRASHALALVMLGPLEHLGFLRSLVRGTQDPALRVHTMGLDFPSPVGLAGGFDKNATRARALAALGFGFLELGTVTALAQAENPPPNLFRLRADRAIVNRLGFPNDGASVVAARVARVGRLPVPVALSIGKSRVVDAGNIDAVLGDYTTSFDAARAVADFVVVNVSSPNTKDLRSLQGPALAKPLFEALRARDATKPLLVKIAPDLADAEVEAVAAAARDAGLSGVVATNTTTARDGLVTPREVVAAMGAGGLSGPPLHARAVDVVRRVRAAWPSATVIGVGGIETGADARRMLDAGADLVQVYTAFIYRGPFAARLVGRELLATRA